MKTICFFIICSLLMLPAFTQVAGNHNSNPDSLSDSKTHPLSFHKKYNNLSFYDRTHISIMTGASFSAIGKESMINTWIAPEIKYAVTPRLYISAGAMVMQSNLNNSPVSPDNENSNSKITGYTHYYLFAHGEYLLNDKITIRATTLQGLPNRSINPSPLSYNSIGMDIKLSDHFSIGADCVFSKGLNSYEMPVNNPFYHSTFPLYNNNFVNW
jgi:hypothetical protein